MENCTYILASLLLELLSEGCELLLQFRGLLMKFFNFSAKRGDFPFQLRYSFSIGGDRNVRRLGCGLGVPFGLFAGQEMRVTRFLGTRLPGKNFCERRLTLHEVLQTGLHGAQIFESVHALRASA